MAYQQQQQYQSQQLMPTMGMQVNGGNRNAAGKPLNSNGKRDWSHGLCGCFESCGTFCFACFCPCIVHGKNKQRLSYLTEHGQPDHDGGSYCSGSCFAHCLLSSCGLSGFLQCSNRGDTRSRYGIDGGGCGDCCAAFCCAPCDLTQVSREIELEEKSFGQRY
ncbi:PLAC8-domain-containing protein [Mycena olivaceomarginata]|nr:PLAC8-domain-containing protein [Mycena olivaceomarginata]